ncbi:hypothetical protein [Vreelandella lutescens]|uniref:Uncharacterized protein n=1 Tax=Vreelandella lutescens TaxID=1602943 RepID=A0ABQ1P0E2_9GAMM|nr:hypothetical protein [Halomonas lutescens]GGC88548.1 hypothetical protein GCM10011382_18440 [Halomonas lutescens]
MQPNQLMDISQAGLQLAIQEIKEEMFDTPQCDYTIAKLLSHCGQFAAAERHIDDMLLKWGASPDVIDLTEQAYADMAALSAHTAAQATLHIAQRTPTFTQSSAVA